MQKVVYLTQSKNQRITTETQVCTGGTGRLVWVDAASIMKLGVCFLLSFRAGQHACVCVSL